MTTITITSDNLESKINLEEDATSTEMIENFCRLLLLQTYQIGSLIDSLNEVRQELIDEVKIAYEDLSNK